MKLLIVEDEVRMAELLRKGLTEEGHTATCASDGAEGLEMAKSYEFDVIILDIMMPKLSGYELAKRLRAEKVRTPILMLTARDAVPDIVRGLDLGADDYMTKPFSFEELVARLRAVKRRALAAQNTTLQVGDLVLDPSSREVLRGEQRIALTRTEYNLLERLMYRAGKVVSRRSLIEAVWGPGTTVEDNTLEEVEKGVWIPFIHRPLSRYVNALTSVGLYVTKMFEPEPPPGFLARAEEYAEAATIPRLLGLRAEKLRLATV